MHTTSRLGLDVVDGTDNVNNYPTVDAQAKSILDFAAIYNEGTLAGRPAANAAGLARGTAYRTTDAGAETLSWTDGALWLPLGLLPAIVAGNTPAVSGQAIITTGSGAIAVALPTPTSGAMVAVVNRTTNVTTVSGSNIQGAGLSSASSFPLGSAGASAILLADGTNWTFLAGQQDSGWVALTLTGGWSTYNPGPSYYVPAARIVGNRVDLRGAASSGGPGANPASLPSATFAPTSTVRSFSQPAGVFITVTAGSTAIALSAAQSPVYFDGVSYSLV